LEEFPLAVSGGERCDKGPVPYLQTKPIRSTLAHTQDPVAVIDLQAHVHAVVIEENLRAVFYVENDMVVTFNIGTHAIYKA
jgi:hypothetical protein